MEKKEKLKKERGAVIIPLRWRENTGQWSSLRVQPGKEGVPVCMYTDTHMHVAMRVHSFCLLPRMVIYPHFLRFHT
jgi:hypothetical protein